MKIAKEVKIALLGIIALCALIFGVNFLKGRGAFGSNRTFYAIYDNAQGLPEGGFVQIHGVNIGSVRRVMIHPKHPEKVLVEYLITSKDVNFPMDSKAAVLSDGLISAKVLGILPGAATTYLKDGDTIATYKEEGLMDKIGTDAQPIMKNVNGVVTKADAAIGTIDNTVANINSLIDANTKANLQSSIAGLNRSVQDFNELSNSLAAQRQKIASTISSLEAFASNLNKNNAAINGTLANVQTTTKKLSEADITNTVAQLKNTLGDLDATLGKINSNQGTLGMLVNDKKMYNDLQGSMHSLDALLADLKARPSRYINFSVFGKKNKDEPVKTITTQ